MHAVKDLCTRISIVSKPSVKVAYVSCFAPIQHNFPVMPTYTNANTDCTNDSWAATISLSSKLRCLLKRTALV